LVQTTLTPAGRRWNTSPPYCQTATASPKRKTTFCESKDYIALEGAAMKKTTVKWHIRINLATVSRFKPATPTRQKVATHSHFKVATFRRAGVRDKPVIDNARNSNAAC
jgi:hypothetical protein